MFVVFILKVFSRLPFTVIYIISDFLYLCVKLVKYRKNVVYTNLRNSFPEKDEKEIKQIANRFYRHFCDLILESIKLYSITEKELNERVNFKSAELLNNYARQGKSAIVLGAHYNNWEWCSSIQRFLDHQLLIVFNQVRNNKPMEEFLNYSRERFGSKTISIGNPTQIIRSITGSEPSCLFLAADQTSPRNSQFWTIFLNQETPFYAGPQRIATLANVPVIVQDTRKTGRGRYEIELIELIPEPDKVEPEAILLAYAEYLENMIKEAPEYWLWSHRRWKHKRPENIPLTQKKELIVRG